MRQNLFRKSASLPYLLQMLLETSLSCQPPKAIASAQQMLLAQGHIPFLGRPTPNEKPGGILASAWNDS